MVWVSISTAAVLLVCYFLFNYRSQLRFESQAVSYRVKYMHMVADMETMVIRLNNIGSLADQIKDEKVLNYYFGTLKLVENLIIAMCQIPSFGDDLSLLNSTNHLVKRCEDRVNKAMKAVEGDLSGATPKYLKIFRRKREDAQPAKGCYFCSRPYIRDYFKIVNTKINGVTVKVYGCRICREELGKSRKVKVLYFIEDGEPVHWEKARDFSPSEVYWNLNRKRQKPRLEFVYSKATEESEET